MVKRFFVVLFLFAWTLWRLDGFSLEKIQGSLQIGSAVEPSEETLAFLKQPYRYLAKGHQCFAFVSEDGKNVIKFFNYSRFSLPFPLEHISYFEPLYQKRQARFAPTMQSYEIAEAYLREETGLIYVHLQKGGKLPILELEDRGKRHHRIDLNQTAFILQKFATPIYEELEKRFQTLGKEGLEESLSCFLALLQKRCQLGIADDDRDVEINFGFCEKKPMLLDPGRLYFEKSLQSKVGIEKELRAATKKLRRYLAKTHPEEALFLEEQLQALSS